MKKLLLIIATMFLFTGCLDPEYIEEASIHKYTMDKYSAILKKNNISEFKCVPTKNGYKTYYFDKKIPNDYPATFIVIGINDTFNVLFDKEYKLQPKKVLLTDIDGCFTQLEKIIEADISWK